MEKFDRLSVEYGQDACDQLLEYSEDFLLFDAQIQSLATLEDEVYEFDDIALLNMTSLGAFVFLEQHSSRNDLTNIDASSDSQSSDSQEQKRLTLAYEQLKQVPRPILERFALTITSLDISYNNFSNVDFLAEFKYLTNLVADHNEISSNTVLPFMPNLQLLWLNYCKIDQLIPWAWKLQHSCPNLRHISLMGNRAAPSFINGGSFDEYLKYRLYMVSIFPNLVHLDDRPVTQEQREKAKTLYRRHSIFKRLESRTLLSLPDTIREKATSALYLFQNEKATKFLMPPQLKPEKAWRNSIV